MTKIIECVPNFSEGRNTKVIDKIVQTIASVEGVTILDRTSDVDHNRTVITFIGTPNGVLEAACKMVAIASELIDLDKQEGIHPRIGATDVVPLIPVKGVTFEECIELAKKIGDFIGSKLQIPVYLYEKAATRIDHRNLANLRKPNATKIHPDYGPHKIGPAGATCIGVRDFLIAYNINLKTHDIEIAKTIAKKIREKDGGLPFVKALGLYLKEKNCVQVSMNLTNFRVTNKDQVYKEVTKLAEEMGTEILEEEIIGLLPEDVLEATSQKDHHL